MAREESVSVDISARTIEQAIDKGLTQLGVEKAEVQVEVLRKPGRGFFGLGASEALVRLTLLRPRPAVEELPPARPEAVVMAQQILQSLLERMDVSAQVETFHLEGRPVILNISGQNLGILIGRRGQTIRSLEFLTRLMVSRKLRRRVRFSVDVERYRLRREENLKSLARRMADRAVRSRRSVSLEPMPAYERRIIHIALRDYEGVRTQSIGEGEKRKVMIVPQP